MDQAIYEVKKVFRFDIRPTAQIWRASQMHELLDKLTENLAEKPAPEQALYNSICVKFRQLNQEFLESRE